jgi:NADH-quinone oxidoreductase subunit H
MLEFTSTQFGFSIVLMLALYGMLLGLVAYLILLERRMAAWIQDRLGPNRAGPQGLFQPIADGVKFLLKEDITSANVDRPVFLLAPCVAFILASIGYAVIPWAGTVQIGGNELRVQVASVDIGLLFILAVGALNVYGVVLGGWASNNKYSFYGGMRATAQMLSYEIPMGLAILVVVMTSGQLRLENIVAAQINPAMGGAWNVLLHPVAFIILLICSFAEANRTPFDLAEAEQELIGGYQTEYSSMKMSLFYLGEYFHIITAGAFMTVLFLGGWELFPFSERLGWGWLHWLNNSPSWPAALLRFSVVLGKIIAIVMFFMWVRWTIPRFRYDQLMRLAWRGLVPMSLAIVAVVGVLVYWGRPVSIWATVGDLAVVAAALAFMASRKPEMTGRQENLPPVLTHRTRGVST